MAHGGRTGRLRRATAVVLAAVLLLNVPGLECYRILAADFSHAGSAPKPLSPWVPFVGSLMLAKGPNFSQARDLGRDPGP